MSVRDAIHILERESPSDRIGMRCTLRRGDPSHRPSVATRGREMPHGRLRTRLVELRHLERTQLVRSLHCHLRARIIFGRLRPALLVHSYHRAHIPTSRLARRYPCGGHPLPIRDLRPYLTLPGIQSAAIHLPRLLPDAKRL